MIACSVTLKKLLFIKPGNKCLIYLFVFLFLRHDGVARNVVVVN